MKYCTHCGNSLVDQAAVCPKCGFAVSGCTLVAREQDAPSTGMTVLGAFFPLVGLILYLVWKDDKPQKAKSAGKGAIIGAIITAAIYVLYVLVSMIYLVMIGSFVLLY